jgi:DNA-binding transcriptional ArsR family regulator
MGAVSVKIYDKFGQILRIEVTCKVNNRNFKGFNFFNKDDEKILLAVADGKYCVRDLANKDIRKQLISKNSNQVSRILKRLRMHGMIKKIRKSYRYHLTVLGKQVISAGLKFKNMSLIPELSKVY